MNLLQKTRCDCEGEVPLQSQRRIMTRIQLLLIYCLSILFLTGCGENIDLLHDEVMKVHDDVMPRMGEMHQLRLELESMMADKDSVGRLPYLEAIGELRKGEEMMWAWMNDYRKPTSSSTESLEYLRKQQVEVTKVADQMTRAIEYSNELLP